jgi:hypothetical protein
VKLGLNGVPAEKLGSLSMGDLVSETTSRMESYVGKVLTLIADAGETQSHLAFEADLLDAYIEGLGNDKTGATDLSGITVQSAAPGAPPAATATATKSAVKAKRSVGGLLLANACKAPAKSEPATIAGAKATTAPVAAKTAPASDPAGEKPLAQKAGAAKPAPKAAEKPAPKPAAAVASTAPSGPTKQAVVTNKPGEAKAEVFIFSSTSTEAGRTTASEDKSAKAPAAPAKPTAEPVAKPAPAAPAKPAAPPDCSVSMERDGKKICL